MKGTLKGLTAAAVAALAASAGAAQVQTPANQTTTISPIQVSANSVRVSYRDLNLDTEAGKGVMRARITRASHYVCGIDMQPLSVQMERLACVSDAKQGAFDQLAAAARVRTYAQAADQVLVLALNR